MSKVKIAIIGHGFVGKAVDYGFSSRSVEKFIIDPIYGNSVETLAHQDIDFAFVCVPTPMGEDGTINADIVKACVDSLYLNTNCKAIIVKSTVVPSVLSEFTHYHNFVYNPEFLTEKNANNDFIKPIMHVFGGDKEVTEQVEQLYQDYSLCSKCPVYHMSVQEASFVKYGINTFLATKVTWFNEYYKLVNDHGANFNKIITAIGTDDRVGSSHTIVPGPDSKLGFGGACFTKDVSAFLKFGGTDSLQLLNLAKNVNNKIRSQYELDDREKAQKVSYKV